MYAGMVQSAINQLLPKLHPPVFGNLLLILQYLLSRSLNYMGWTVGTGCSKWDTLVRSQSVHSLPWYSGMGWTVGTSYTKWGTVGWDTVAWDTVGWDGQ